MTPAASLAFSLFAIAAFSSAVGAQPCRTFDVASIKVNTSDAGGGYPVLAPGGKRFTATRQLMLELIMSAYDVSPLQVSGIPKALFQERYDIAATCEQPITKEQLPRLLQALLAERFHLAIHRELKEQTVYALILGKRGARGLHASQQAGKPVLRQSGYSFTFTNAEMSDLAGLLSQLAGRKVVDRTDLRGPYNFTLRYAPNRPGVDASAAADGLPDSVFTALREQLGLNLEPQKSPVEFIVVDRIDPLIPN